MTKTVKEDTIAIRTEIFDIGQYAIQIPEVMQELARIRTIISENKTTPALFGQIMLERYLNDLTTYAETVYEDVVSERTGCDSSNDAQASTSVNKATFDTQSTESPALLVPGELQPCPIHQNYREIVASLPAKGIHQTRLGPHDKSQLTTVDIDTDSTKTHANLSTKAIAKKVIIMGDRFAGKTSLLL